MLLPIFIMLTLPLFFFAMSKLYLLFLDQLLSPEKILFVLICNAKDLSTFEYLALINCGAKPVCLFVVVGPLKT